MSDTCVECGRDTSFGSGLFVNRIPADDGYICPECFVCERCGIYYDDCECRDDDTTAESMMDGLDTTAITASMLVDVLRKVGAAYVVEDKDAQVFPSELLADLIHELSQSMLVDPNYRPDHFRIQARNYGGGA